MLKFLDLQNDSVEMRGTIGKKENKIKIYTKIFDHLLLNVFYDGQVDYN